MNLVQRKWQWAMQNKLFWWNIALIAGTVSFVGYWHSPGESDFRVKTLGMVLQLIGVGTVWFDLTTTARAFGKTGMIQRTRDWLKAGFAGGATVLISGESEQGADTCNGRGSVRWPVDVNADLASRLEVLEKNFALMDNAISGVLNEFDKQVAEAKARANNEERIRAHAIAEVRRELIEASVGNFPVLVFGAVWLAVGVVLSTWAPEIAKLTAGNWRSVLSSI